MEAPTFEAGSLAAGALRSRAQYGSAAMAPAGTPMPLFGAARLARRAHAPAMPQMLSVAVVVLSE